MTFCRSLIRLLILYTYLSLFAFTIEMFDFFSLFFLFRIFEVLFLSLVRQKKILFCIRAILTV